MNEEQLKALLQQLPTAIAQVKTDVDALVAKASAQGVDLSEEGAIVSSSLQALGDIHAEATGSAPTTGNGQQTAAPATDPAATDASAS